MEFSLVESSEITGEGERCSSTESGWTLYLASPLNDDDDDDDGGRENDDDDGGDGGDVDSDVSVEFHDSTGENRLEEDDSLASDASTGNIDRNNVTTMDHHHHHHHHHDYHSPDADGGNSNYSNHSSNINNEKFKKMERREERRCFGGLFKRGGSSGSCSSKIWKTKLTW